MKVFYLGPAGTFTHEAAQIHFKSFPLEKFDPCKTPSEVMKVLAENKDSFGVVPVENSIQGEVTTTLDALCFEFKNIFVIGEVSIPISFNWYGINSEAKPNIVMSHPHALAQCRKFIYANNLSEHVTSSTAEGCQILTTCRDENYSVIASHTAGKIFNLHALNSEIEDFPGAYTRFLILGNQLLPSRENNRTILALLPPSNKSGVLKQFSGIFTEAGVNIFGLHNRPLRTSPGHYLFIMTVGGSAVEGATRHALEELLDIGYGIKLLGIYTGNLENQPAAPWPDIPGLLRISEYKKLILQLGV